MRRGSARKSADPPAVKVRRGFQFNPALCGIIPLVNVLFLVLVFYSMGSRFILQPGVQIVLPATSFALGPQRNAQIVSISAAPSATLYYRDQKVTLATLLERLEANPAAERSLVIKADRHAPVGLRDEVANEALRRGYSVVLAGDVPRP
jgi:biopolymer transport protein ExbD